MGGRVYRMLGQIVQKQGVQHVLARRSKNNLGCHTGVKCLLPAPSTDAPVVAGFQPREAQFWVGCGQIIALRFCVCEELCVHQSAHAMHSSVLCCHGAVAVAQISRLWSLAARLQRLIQDIEQGRIGFRLIGRLRKRGG